MTKDEERAAAIAKRAALRMERDRAKEKAAGIKSAIKRERALKIMSVPLAEKKSYSYYALKSYRHSSDSFMGEPIQLTNNRF